MLLEQPQDVVSKGQHHDQDQDDEAYHLCPFEDLFRRLPPGDHLVEDKDGVSSVQSRDRQNVDHRQHDGQKGCQLPKSRPIPHGREEAAHRDDAAHALVRAAFGIDQFLDLGQ